MGAQSETKLARIDFEAVNREALRSLPALLRCWLPNGRREGQEWVAINPHRKDQHLGSFKVNMSSGHWADFATGDKGRDVVSLCAFLFDLSQGEAARHLRDVLERRR